MELTALPENQTHIERHQAVSAAWPGAVLYRGLSVFDCVYGNLFPLPGDSQGRENPLAFFQNYLPEQFQECYLGYVPEQDRFLIGFDTWPEDAEEFSSVFSFQLSSDGRISDVRPIRQLDAPSGDFTYFLNPMFYTDNPSNYGMLKRCFPSLVDIRLD